MKCLENAQRWAAASLLMVCLAIRPAPLAAQASDSRVVADSVGNEALRAFEAGVVATRSARWEEARSAFRRSAELAPKASTQFNLAVVCVRLELGGEALAALDAFEDLAQNQGYESMRAKVPALRAEANALLPHTPAREAAPVAAARDTAPQHAPPPALPPTNDDSAAPRRTLIAGGLIGGVALGLGVWALTRGHAYRRCLSDGPADLACYERTTILHERNAARGSAIGLGIASALVLSVGAVRLSRARSLHVGFHAAPQAFGLSLAGAL